MIGNMFKFGFLKGLSILLSVILGFNNVCFGDDLPKEVIPRWLELKRGLSYFETQAPEKSILGDSRIFILKVNPLLCSFGILSASENIGNDRSADSWAKDFHVNVVVNAGMFNMVNHRTNKGYLKNSPPIGRTVNFFA